VNKVEKNRTKHFWDARARHDGEMLQKDIHYELDLTRVQSHRVVQGLVQKNIVAVTDHYNTKKIALVDWFLH
jgi:hypothetical protein